MMNRARRQPQLLERYWSALRRNRNAAPPDGLDPEIARLAARLERDYQPRDARAVFLNQLERRLQDAARGNSWSRPALDTRRAASPPSSDTATDGDTPMSELSEIPRDEPVPLSRRRWRSEALKMAAAVVIFVIVGAVLVLALRGDDDTPTVPAVAPTTTATTFTMAPTATSASVPSVTPATATAATSPTSTRQARSTTPTPLPLAVGTAFGDVGTVSAVTEVGPHPRDIVVAAGSVWMIDGGDGQLYQLDPTTGQVVSTTRISDPADSNDDNPWASITYGADSLWITVAASDGILRRVDPANREITAQIDLGFGPGIVRFGGGSVWINAPFDGKVVRIDPATNSIVATINVDSTNNTIAFTDDAAWVASRQNFQLSRIDFATNTVVATIQINGSGWPIVPFGDSIWVGMGTVPASLKHIDPVTNTVTGSVDIGRSAIHDLVVVGESICVLTEARDTGAMRLTRFDASGEQISSSPLPDAFQGEAYANFAIADGVLWMSLDDGRIVRITLQ